GDTMPDRQTLGQAGLRVDVALVAMELRYAPDDVRTATEQPADHDEDEQRVPPLLHQPLAPEEPPPQPPKAHDLDARREQPHPPVPVGAEHQHLHRQEDEEEAQQPLPPSTPWQPKTRRPPPRRRDGGLGPSVGASVVHTRPPSETLVSITIHAQSPRGLFPPGSRPSARDPPPGSGPHSSVSSTRAADERAAAPFPYSSSRCPAAASPSQSCGSLVA